MKHCTVTLADAHMMLMRDLLSRYIGQCGVRKANEEDDQERTWLAGEINDANYIRNQITLALETPTKSAHDRRGT